MIIRRGAFKGEQEQDNPVLQTPEGDNYKVSYVVAFVWKLLDGKNNENVIVDEIKKVGKLDTDELPNIVNKVITELVKVRLARPLEDA